jgi:hypothetical protein
MLTKIVIFSYNSEQLGTPAFHENYLYLLVQFRVKLERSFHSIRAHCRVEIDTLNYSILIFSFSSAAAMQCVLVKFEH